ncbi:NAD(P)-binding Rossmann-fold containing protein [Glarea lozoyensis ATCC 20868]|uniref:NAD(P)-binding Rossmann-fold containing protein n=1 Tax=Glarea lozoyensis (strain ATCC 20868 / MF5171) TaxID=1116229 RepID=S3D520_GLAL2|nr:NAD(P)-binding Rossmann-fold containing protein [Glarea lozoyensis ATCC 20868]EPE32870.1 NAD(P)-binding Rossmann-fold containing protein [Glarea lozoyensis ATCC 20868]
MPSYVVTGASKGLGFAFIKQLASDPANTVVGIVRDMVATEEKLKKHGIHNVKIYAADITDLPALEAAATEIQRTVGGIDYLIANAAFVSGVTSLRNLSDFAGRPEVLRKDMIDSFSTNVVGFINTVNAFIAGVRTGQVKKVIAITSGMGEIGFKAGVNMAIAKYSAIYRQEGILVFGICPGSIDTDAQNASNLNEEDLKRLQAVGAKTIAYAPHFKGPVSAEEAAKRVLAIVEMARFGDGKAGTTISQTGTDR